MKYLFAVAATIVIVDAAYKGYVVWTYILSERKRSKEETSK